MWKTELTMWMSQCNTATPRYYGDIYQLQNELREKPPRDHAEMK